MNLNDYQEKAMETLLPSANSINYMVYNLQAEVGEVSSIFAKFLRDGFYSREAVAKEMGDVLWQLAGLCHVMEFKLEDIAQKNLDKLAARKLNGTLGGNGDDR
jgi:NTP pyrophosphatase (non-canonical NTP hydrolase)